MVLNLNGNVSIIRDTQGRPRVLWYGQDTYFRWVFLGERRFDVAIALRVHVLSNVAALSHHEFTVVVCCGYEVARGKTRVIEM